MISTVDRLRRGTQEVCDLLAHGCAAGAADVPTARDRDPMTGVATPAASGASAVPAVPVVPALSRMGARQASMSGVTGARRSPSLVSAVEGLDDDGLTGLLREASALRAEVDAVISAAAGVVAKRSERALGYAGLAQRQGHRTPVALVQSLTGATRVEAARQVRLGEALGEADAASRAVGVPEGDRPSAGGETPDLDRSTLSGPDSDQTTPRCDPLPWYEPVTRAVTDHIVSAEGAAAILRGLGQPGEQCDSSALRAAAIEVLAAAQGLDVDELGKRARWARDRIDPVGVRQRARDRFEARSWRFGRTAEGARTAWVVFDDESAVWIDAMVDTALSPRRGGPRFVDPNAAKRAEDMVADRRTNDQLVFDTIMDVLQAGSIADGARIFGAAQPGVRVVITEGEFQARDGEGRIVGSGHYENTGEAVPGSVVERQVCNGGLLPIVVDQDGCPLDVGRERRLFTGKQRVALRIRDGGCLFPGCDRGANYGEAHHIDAWVADHGKTNIADGVLLCRHHHMLLHNNGWKIVRHGIEYNLIPPPEIDPGRRPIPLHSKSPLQYPSTG